MARTKEYEREIVLEKAAVVFWNKGYEASSMDELIKQTGLNSFSLYREFKNKHELFREAMEWYYRAVLLNMTAGLRANPGWEALRGFFNQFPPVLASKDFRGCMFMNSLVEKKLLGEKINSMVRDFCNELTDLFGTSIRSAQKEKKISKKKNPAELAEFLLVFLQGMMLYGRLQKSRDTVQGLVDSLFRDFVS